MNFFAAERTDRTLGGLTIPGVLVPVGQLGGRSSCWRRPCSPGVDGAGAAGTRAQHAHQVGHRAAAVAVGFVFMVVGARAQRGGALVSPLWLVAAYAFHTFGELCLSPVGLSMVTKLAPAEDRVADDGRLVLRHRVAEFLAGQLAALTEKMARGEVFHLFGGQADFFLVFVVISVARRCCCSR